MIGVLFTLGFKMSDHSECSNLILVTSVLMMIVLWPFFLGGYVFHGFNERR